MRSNPKVDGHIIEPENPQHIRNIRKFYTDGKIKPIAYAGFFFCCDSSTQSDWYKMTNFEKLFNTIYLNANEDPDFYKKAEKRYTTRAYSPRLSTSAEYLFLKISQASFILSEYLDPNFYDLTMRVKDFNFDGSKLPTEEEVQKLEVPKQYRKEISKKANYIVSKAIGKDAL